jgi:putative heme-binding domain-containing protein
LVTGLEGSTIPTGLLSSPEIRFLRSHPDSNIRARAISLYGPAAVAPRTEVVNRYAITLQLGGNPAHGRELFLQRCANCHQIAGLGNALGLDLAAAAKTGGQKLLVKIIAPNLQLPADHRATLVQTKSGATLTGFIAAQTPTSITLWQANGVGRVVGRERIQTMTTLGFSAMPEGLEAGLSSPAMADLLAFLTSAVATR